MMTPELRKELVIDGLSVFLTALFTGIPAMLLFWWTRRRDQERLFVQKLFMNVQTATGNLVPERDELGRVFGILIRNLSLFPVHVSAVGFEIDGEIIELEHPMFPAKMKRNPDQRSKLTYIADDDADVREIASLRSTQVSMTDEDRPKIAHALLTASAKRKLCVDELLSSRRVIALVALESGKQFASPTPFLWRIGRTARHRLRRRR